MKTNKICSSLIKPVTPTPPNLKNYQISFWDSQQRPANILVVLFYESKPESESDRYSELEETLAETLVQFYPLAGRFIKELNSVDCTDQGAEFLRAEAPGQDLASVIGADHHNHLIPDHYFHLHESSSQPLLSVQATSFTCGGMAVAVSVSHRVFDVSSLATFLAVWSSTAKLGKTATASPLGPLFDLPSLLPVKNTDSFNFVVANPTTRENAAVKKLHFDNAALLRLKSKIGKAVSAGRAAAAAIAKALILLDAAKRGGGGGACRGFRIFQAVNMRERTTAPVAKHACGNFSFLSGSRRVEAPEAEGISLPELSALIGETVRRCIVDYAGIASADGDGREIIIRNREKSSADTDTDTNTLVFTDWSKFGFYDVDFRWGNAVWASTLPPQTRNYYVALMSNREGDGIEAWLRFNRSDMHRFHQDSDFMDQVIYDLSN